ncbi:MAG: putative Fe-S cluster assembly protein SufT [Thiotrichales bacterium]|nr:MAG: putative Fe-S cluster assembly protein SufT [Thiotrichales bacterium]
MNSGDITIIKHSVKGCLIPQGHEIELLPGTEVLVTQDLGGSFTLNVNGNLVRIEGKDADAIGREVKPLPSDGINSSDVVITKELVLDQLRTCYDPEIPVNIVDLGLIYNVEVTEQEQGIHVGIQMTLTAAGCGMGPVIARDVEDKVKAFSKVCVVDVVLVFDPPWNASLMTAAARLELGLM